VSARTAACRACSSATPCGARRGRGVAGWASNEPDGTVEAVFEGAPADVEALVELARHGPGQAEVERLDVHDEEPEGLHGFEVR
jgi:acylphosphatase